MDNENVTDEQYIRQTELRARQKARDITNLQHQQKGIEVEIERAKAYLELLNGFLQAEGSHPVLLMEHPTINRIGTPGNRSKQKPIRKIEWDGMSLIAIVREIVDASPNETQNAERILPKIFEIKSPTDRAMVIRDVRSALQIGAREGYWDRTTRGQYKSKKAVIQRMPINA